MLDGMSEGNGRGGIPSGRPAFQQTLKDSIHCTGTGLHSGERVQLALVPARPDTGVVFRRTDVSGRMRDIPARYDMVADTRMCSTIANPDGVSVATIEHLMAALAGCDIDNVIVELSGPEVPAMDGSAEPFVFLIECAGVAIQDAPRRAVRVLRPVSVEESGNYAELRPSDGFSIDVSIEFDNTAIGIQSLRTEVRQSSFKRDIARARTFGFLQEVEALRSAGLGLGGSLDNAVIINGDRVMNEDGLRYADEFVRHKVLDCIGDLALVGAPLLAHVVAFRPGHRLNNMLLRALFSDRNNWELAALDEKAMAPLLAAAE